MGKSQSVGFRCPDELLNQIDAEAKRRGVSRSTLIVERLRSIYVEPSADSGAIGSVIARLNDRMSHVEKAVEEIDEALDGLRSFE